MRRILLLMAVAAMMLALTAGPALADAPAPGDVPVQGDPQTPTTNPATPTQTTTTAPDTGNCYGADNSNTRKGPGPAPSGGLANPGSLAEPTTFNGQPDYTGHAVSTLPSGDIADFQLAYKDAFAACGQTA
jgi:hypothetical protein